MTTLRDGTVVDESITAFNYTKAADVPRTFGQGKRRIEGITIHHWGLEGQNFDGVVRYLASNNGRGSSAHAVIMAGRATSIVHPDDAAWHAGNALGQTITIGLELRPEATDGDYVTAAAYIAFLWDIYGEVPLYPHKYWKATACPGKWDLARLVRMAKEFRLSPQGVITPEEDMATAKEIVDELLGRTIPRQGGGVTGNTNLGALIAWMDANLGAISVNTVNEKFKNLYGTEVSIASQLGWIDKNINDYHKEMKALIGGLTAPVVLSGDDVAAIAAALKESLAPAVVAELAKRLTTE